jgi:hypothetical protein
MYSEHDVKKYDIFISYARVNNKILPSLKYGWVDTFQMTLQQVLEENHGRNDSVNIFFDTRDIKGYQNIDEAIKSALENSYVMIIIFSRGYLMSDWCLEELDYFSDLIDDNDRVIPIFIEDEKEAKKIINQDNRFLKLRNRQGYQFYDLKNEKRLGYPITDYLNEPAYITNIMKLGKDIAFKLNISLDKKGKDNFLKQKNLTNYYKMKKQYVEQNTNKKNSDSHFIFINIAQKNQAPLDKISSQTLANVLNEKEVPYAIKVDDTNISPMDMRKDFEDSLKMCSVMVLFCGDTPITWLREQIRYAWSRRNMPDRFRPLKRIALFNTARLEGECGIGICVSELRIFPCLTLRERECFLAFIEDIKAL